MKDGPIILGDGLEIHYIQKNSGKENEFFEAYKLRKDFGHGDIKTLRRGIPSIIKSLASFRQPIAKDTMESLIKIARQFDDDNRNAYEILIADSPLAQVAILELGKEKVRDISYGHRYDRIRGESEMYLNTLRTRLADVYLADNSKSHLREYVDDKFGADLGL